MKSRLGPRRRYNESIASQSSTEMQRAGDLLLDQLLRVVQDSSERLFVRFIDSTYRDTCRPEHRWFVDTHAHVIVVRLSVCLFVCLLATFRQTLHNRFA